jgi:tetratricopeptide (TPR) repeat protein
MMSSATAPPARNRAWRWRKPVRLALAAALLGVGAWQASVHAAAWSELKEGRAALARDDAEAARRHLARCLEAWPQSAEANFLAARAARRCGEFAEAEHHLQLAARLGRPADDIEVEAALAQAQSGNLAQAEPVLHRHLRAGHPAGPQIAEVLVPAYMANFWIGEANEVAGKWVELAPNSARAWSYRADTLERLRKKEASLAAYRRFAELAPEDRRARLGVARMVIETRQAPDEAAAHLEWLTAGDPSDAAALIQLAACREAQGRTDEAAAILDRVLARSESGKALHYRGRLEVNRGRPEAGLPFLRRAAELEPWDVELLYNLYVCTQQAGTPEEVRRAEERWRRCDADLKRAGELAKAINASPYDPELRREIGELFLRNSRTEDGVRWLESALRVRPDHAPTHRLLADYYDRAGQPGRAARHREFLGGTPPPGVRR